jgi:hypothetical protein
LPRVVTRGYYCCALFKGFLFQQLKRSCFIGTIKDGEENDNHFFAKGNGAIIFMANSSKK